MVVLDPVPYTSNFVLSQIPVGTGQYRRYRMVPDYFKIYYFSSSTRQYQSVPVNSGQVPDKHRTIFFIFIFNKCVQYIINTIMRK